MKNDTNKELYGAEDQKVQGLKFAITTILVAAVVLGIAVWGIIFIISNASRDTNIAKTTSSETSSKKDSSSQEVVEVTDLDSSAEDSGAASDESSDAEVSETGDAADQGAATAEVPTTTTSVANGTSAKNNIPKTGPEDILPVALLAGLVVSYFGSRRLVKSLA